MSRSAVALLAALGLVVLLCGQAAASKLESSLVGKDVPSFQGKDVDGGEVGTEQARKQAQVVVVNFWGLRCGDCIAEIPHLNAIHEKYRDKGVRVWGVNVDGADAEVIRTGVRGFPVPPAYSLVPDKEFKLMDLFSVMAAPFTVVVSPAGKVVYQHEGFQAGDEKELEEQVRRALAP